MIKFNNQFDNKDCKPVVMDKTDTVERAGYIPLADQLRAYREAGVLLKATRALEYQHNEDDGFKGLDNDDINPLFISGGVDYSDMSALARRSEALYKVVNGSKNITSDSATSTTGTLEAEPSLEK